VTPSQVNRLVVQVADKSQVGTIRVGHRPYGIGLLVAGADSTGPHLFETQPSGQYFEYKAWAIGARSQAGRTYLEKHFEAFAALELDELISHALLALRETMATGTELTSANAAIGFVSEGQAFTIMENDAIKPYLDAIKKDEVPAAAPAAAADAPAGGAAAMDEE